MSRVPEESRLLSIKAFLALWFSFGLLFAFWANSMSSPDSHLPYWFRIGWGVAYAFVLLSEYERTAKRFLRVVRGDEEDR